MGRTISIKRLKRAVISLLLILGMFSFTSYSESKDSKSEDIKLNSSTISKERNWVDIITVNKNSEDLWKGTISNIDIRCDSIYLVIDTPSSNEITIKKHSKNKIEEIGRFPYDALSNLKISQILVDGDDYYILCTTRYGVNMWKYTPSNKWQLIYRKNISDSDDFIEDRFVFQLLPDKELYLSSCVMNILGEEKVIVRKYTGTPEKCNKMAEIPVELTTHSNYYIILQYIAITNDKTLYIMYTKIDYKKGEDKYSVKIVIKEGKVGGKIWTIEDENLTDLYNYNHKIDYCILVKNNEIYIEYTRRDLERKSGFDLAVKKIKGDTIVDVCHLPSGELKAEYAYIPGWDNIEVMNNGDIYLYNVLELVKFHNGSSDIIYKAADSERIEAMCVYNEIPYILVYKSKEENYILKYLSKD